MRSNKHQTLPLRELFVSLFFAVAGGLFLEEVRIRKIDVDCVATVRVEDFAGHYWVRIFVDARS